MREGRLRDGTLTAPGVKWLRLKPERFVVSDLIYLVIGVGVLALMALYALACDRL